MKYTTNFSACQHFFKLFLNFFTQETLLSFSALVREPCHYTKPFQACQVFFKTFFKLFSVRFSGAAALADSFAIITNHLAFVNSFLQLFLYNITRSLVFRTQFTQAFTLYSTALCKPYYLLNNSCPTKPCMI